MRKIFPASLIVILSLSSCEITNTLCHENATLPALKERILASTLLMSEYINETYQIEDTESKIRSIVESELILEGLDYQGELPGYESSAACTCSINMSFTENEGFMEYIEPTVQETKGISNKNSSEYLKNEHLVKYGNEGAYPFFFIISTLERDTVASPLDNKIGSVLMDYLVFRDGGGSK